MGRQRTRNLSEKPATNSLGDAGASWRSGGAISAGREALPDRAAQILIEDQKVRHEQYEEEERGAALEVEPSFSFSAEDRCQNITDPEEGGDEVK